MSTKAELLAELLSLIEYRDPWHPDYSSTSVQVIAGHSERFWEIMEALKSAQGEQS